MTKIRQSPYDTMNGTLGNLIGGSWRGIGYLRVRPANQHDRNSLKQQNHRARFKACVAFTKSLRIDLVNPVWDKLAVKQSASNLFVKTNMPVFDSSGTITDYGNLKISIGRLPLTKNIVVQNDGTTAGSIRITWDDNSGKDIAASTDRLRVVYITGTDAVVMEGLVFTRSEELATVQLAGVSGQTVHVYVFFEDAASETFSESFYAMVAIPIVPAN